MHNHIVPVAVLVRRAHSLRFSGSVLACWILLRVRICGSNFHTTFAAWFLPVLNTVVAFALQVRLVAHHRLPRLLAPPPLPHVFCIPLSLWFTRLHFTADYARFNMPYTYSGSTVLLLVLWFYATVWFTPFIYLHSRVWITGSRFSSPFCLPTPAARY